MCMHFVRSVQLLTTHSTAYSALTVHASWRGNPCESKSVRKFMQTLARRDKHLGKVSSHATEIFSTTFCRYEVELAKLTLGAIRAFLAGMPAGAQMDQVSDPGALRRMLVDYAGVLAYPWIVSANCNITRTMGQRGTVYQLKQNELPTLGEAGVRDFTQV